VIAIEMTYNDHEIVDNQNEANAVKKSSTVILKWDKTGLTQGSIECFPVTRQP